MNGMRVVECPWCGLLGRMDGPNCVWCLRPLHTEHKPSRPAVYRVLLPNFWAALRAMSAWASLFAVTSLLLAASAVAILPTWEALADAVLHWGLLGLLTIACVFALAKRRIDLSGAGVAFLAAQITLWAVARAGAYGMFLAPVAGALIGAAVAVIASSGGPAGVAATASVGAVALALASEASAALPSLPETLQIIRQATIGPVSVGVVIFPVLVPLMKVLAERRIFWPVVEHANAGNTGEQHGAGPTLAAFALGGAIAGIAGLLVISAENRLLVQPTSPKWLVLPVAAAVIGGASLSNGRAGVGAAVVGATWLTSLQAICAELKMPLVEPLTILAVVGIAAGGARLTELSWGDTWRLIRGEFDVAVPWERLTQLTPALEVIRKTRFVFLGLLVFMAYGYVAAYVIVRTPPGAALVSDVVGQVEVYDPSFRHWRPLEVGDLVTEQMWIRTSSSARAELRLSDGSFIQLFQNTEFGIEELREAATGTMRRFFQMPLGELLASARKLPTPDSYFQIQAAAVVVGVRGTTFYVRVTPELLEVTTLEGEVVVDRTVEEIDEQGTPRVRRETTIVPAGFKAWGLLKLRKQMLEEGETPPPIIDKAVAPRAEKTEIERLKRRVRTRVTVTLTNRDFWRGCLAVLVTYVAFVILAQFDFGAGPPRDEERYIRERARYFEQWSARRWWRRRRGK